MPLRAPWPDSPTLGAFRDILVMPTQDLRNGLGRRRPKPLRELYRGGPVWPWHAVRARTCRGWLPWPRDRRPEVAAGTPEIPADAGLWCGPASPHYGHMIADFGMRIAVASRCARSLPLVFSVGPEDAPAPAPFFWELLGHFGVPAVRVHLVRQPTRFRRLYVPPQAERLGGPGPDRSHLDLMDTITAAHGRVAQDIGCLFVSRAALPDGRLAGEGYLGDALRQAGATVIHPEFLSVADQLAHYRRARKIVFSEGSAVHSLQMLGRLNARVAVIVRRPGHQLARAALRPRVTALAYWDAAQARVHGLNGQGRPQWERALAIYAGDTLCARFAALGVDLAAVWNPDAYRDALAADLSRWIAYNGLLRLHPDALPTIRRSLAPLGVPVDIDAAWRGEITGQAEMSTLRNSWVSPVERTGLLEQARG